MSEWYRMEKIFSRNTFMALHLPFRSLLAPAETIRASGGCRSHIEGPLRVECFNSHFASVRSHFSFVVVPNDHS
eukprot:scaffold84771_cov43-Attheya_sp.AAC.3